MKLCAGLCYYNPAGGGCTIRLSQPLLQFRPRSDLIDTLLHEMIHALLFLCPDARIKHDHESHGPDFQWHMDRINREAGTRITVYHTFHDEVDYYRRFVYRCDGPCRNRPPYYGLVRRSMRRQPGPSDRWWEEHRQQCGGTYHRIDDEDDDDDGNHKGEARGKAARKPQQQHTDDDIKQTTRKVNTLDRYFSRLPGAGKTLQDVSPASAAIAMTSNPFIDETAENCSGDNNYESQLIECPCCPVFVLIRDINQHLEREHSFS
jgi:predicted SprT family Zn-dependent metalloprotease